MLRLFLGQPKVHLGYLSAFAVLRVSESVRKGMKCPMLSERHLGQCMADVTSAVQAVLPLHCTLRFAGMTQPAFRSPPAEPIHYII